MWLYESLIFFINSLMDTIHEREMYMNRKSIYIK